MRTGLVHKGRQSFFVRFERLMFNNLMLKLDGNLMNEEQVSITAEHWGTANVIYLTKFAKRDAESSFRYFRNNFNLNVIFRSIVPFIFCDSVRYHYRSNTFSLFLFRSVNTIQFNIRIGMI